MPRSGTFRLLLVALFAPFLSLHAQPVAAANGSIAVPAGTRVHMAMVRPLWLKKAAAGDAVCRDQIAPDPVAGAIVPAFAASSSSGLSSIAGGL